MAAVIILAVTSSWWMDASAAPSAIVYVDMSGVDTINTQASVGETVRLMVSGGSAQPDRDIPPVVIGNVIEFTLGMSAVSFSPPKPFYWQWDLAPLPDGIYTIKYYRQVWLGNTPDPKYLVATQTLTMGPRPDPQESMPAGSGDASFGTQAIARVFLSVSGGVSEPIRIIQQGNGRVLVGAGGGSMASARLLDTGAADGTFGVKGFLAPGATRGYWGRAMVGGTADEILTAGTAYLAGADTFAIARYTSDGVFSSEIVIPAQTLQSSAPSNARSRATDVIVEAGGRIVAAGVVEASSSDFCSGSWYVIRMDAAGRFDPSFGDGGIYRGAFAGCVDRLVPMNDGGILALGIDSTTGNRFVLKLHSNGIPDLSFGSAGFATGAFTPARPQVQADGKIVLGGRDFSLVRLNANGSLDTAFANGGVLQNRTGLSLLLQDFLLQKDGGYLMVGAQLIRTGVPGFPDMPVYRPVVARYRETGELDRRFGTDGVSVVGSQLTISAQGLSESLSLLALSNGMAALAMPDASSGLGNRMLAVYRFRSEPGPDNYQGSWWNPSESGWGVSLAHQGDTVFATWFTFDLDGSPLWMVVAASKTAPNVYSGTLYRGTGPAFNATFDPTKVVGTPVGTATFTFSGNDNATFAYDVGGAAQTKNITRQVFSSPVPVCTWGVQSNLSLATNYQDLWWNAPAGSESGWGITFTHQGDTIFATWFTFGPDGKPLWLVVGAPKTGAKSYGGTLYRVSGPPFGEVFDPSKVVGTPVGQAAFTFSDGNNAIFAYTVDGVSQSKPITREVFATPGTRCQ